MYCYESILRKCDLQNMLDICNKTSKSWHLRNVISGVYTEKKNYSHGLWAVMCRLSYIPRPIIGTYTFSSIHICK